ncbi:MAG TPA: hypothetical protein VLK24_09475 [Gaiellaceae bacterium]|nr:hypothetical protein [Gaiellaceae bacterium]
MTPRRLALALATLVAALAAGTASPAAPSPSTAPAVGAKTCSAGFKHAVIGGQEKCLRAGEFCAHRYDSQYRRYGYRCIRRDSNGRYHLTHA